jgi:hypothetical protein
VCGNAKEPMGCVRAAFCFVVFLISADMPYSFSQCPAGSWCAGGSADAVEVSCARMPHAPASCSHHGCFYYFCFCVDGTVKYPICCAHHAACTCLLILLVVAVIGSRCAGCRLSLTLCCDSQCGTGTYVTNETASSQGDACTACEPGTVCSNGVKTACPAGSWCAGGSADAIEVSCARIPHAPAFWLT